MFNVASLIYNIVCIPQECIVQLIDITEALISNDDIVRKLVDDPKNDWSHTKIAPFNPT
jgi:hypothetical protein